MRTTALATLLAVSSFTVPAAAQSDDWADHALHDYADALAKSLLFYETQRSGPHDPAYTWRVSWREPAALDDGADVGLDLSGGWYDAGDHVKFGLPMSFSAAMLGWTLYEYPTAYGDELAYARDNLRFVLDYLLRIYQPGDPTTFDDDFVVYQVANGEDDHAFWGPPELMTMPRPTYTCDSARPCTEITAGSAAALAIGAKVFADVDPVYAEILLEKAKAMYDFAARFRGNSGYIEAESFYPSYSGWGDELAWAATWLYIADGDASYLADAETMINDPATSNDYAGWTISWDNSATATNLLLARITGSATYTSRMDTHMAFWLGGAVARTDGGLAWLTRWGSLRYSANASWLALLYARDIDASRPSDAADYRTFAFQQMNYILGTNPRGSSYVVGFGVNPPINPHHPGAHGSTVNSLFIPTNNLHELTGALVGGPASADDFDWVDDRTDWIRNEVTTDYNAGFTGALAGLLGLLDGAPPPPPPPPPPPANLVVAMDVTNDWGTGYCADVTVTNDGGSAAQWAIELEIEGVMSSLWSATATQDDTILSASGLSWNSTLSAGGQVTFGFCADRPAPPPPPPPPPPPASGGAGTTVTVSSDWGSGYCADVVVANSTSATVDWTTAFTVEGTVNTLWNAVWSQQGGEVTAEGLSWNNTIAPGAEVAFGFCAQR